ncbi:MAG: hypothetical protein FD187_2335 [bacterium]|nr:MAG: hypothetical protein FD142_2447 [bacterium]KAF0148014.1 MAG: hypothetical protein FD187_2335 [bacterium]KAF0164890.1 MAG: hypothetical protein FD158_2991 [bacterium]TXT16905.1 MAG: hypothetical protein FD132_2657 [bacterium]
MNKQQHPQPDLPRDVQQNSPTVDQSRRSFGKAGLAAPVVLATLASRPVLGATCLTPSAAGSGNHSQHNPITTGCSPQTPQWWIDNAPKNNGGQVQQNQAWPGTGNPGIKPSDPFHPLFTAGPFLNMAKGNNQSYSLWEVLNGLTPNAPFPGPADLAKWFVAGLLNAASGKYGGVIQAIGPDPSVRGIEDEFARNGFFAPTAGKKWYADTIKAYLNDPGSVF